MSLFLAVLLIVVLLASWGLTLFGLPGNWLIVAATTVYAVLVPAQSSAAVGWRVVVGLLILAAVGELVELLAGAFGVARLGGSRRGAVLALLGSVVGSVIGLFVGLPIPVVGSLLAAILFAAAGALVGAMLGERWRGRNLRDSWQIGKEAFRGRLLGTLAKLLIGGLMILTVLVALIW